MGKNLYSLFLIFIVTFTNAQNASISGQVLSSDQKGAEFVSIGLKGLPQGTITDVNGNFNLKNVAQGSQTLIISCTGLSSTEISVTVTDDQSIVIPVIHLTESAKELEEVLIMSHRNLNEKTVNIGKSGIKAMDLPQSISSIDKEIIELQQTQYMSDALKNFNGVYLMGTTGGVQQEIAARGFALSSSNTFKNGVRFNNAIIPEMSAIEQIEVMKGSTAILFGNVAAGGIINMVTKKPNFTQGGEIGMRFDSYNFYKPSIDIYGLLDKNKKAAYRMVSTYENSGSFRDEVKAERIYINPSFHFKLQKKTDLIVEGDYLKDNRTSDFGVGSINYELIDIPRQQFIGAKWSNYRTEQKSITTTIQHRFNSNWQLKAVAAAQYFNNDLFGTTRPNSNNQFIQSNGKWIRGVQRTGINESYYLAQVDLTGKFNTGYLKHFVLIGGDMDTYATSTIAYNTINTYDSINVYNMDLYKQRLDIPELNKKTNTETPIQRSGFYLQDLIDLGQKLKLLAGVRFSYIENASRVYTYSNETSTYIKQYNFATTPRFGLVYQPSKKISFFGSFANSFTPNTGVDINGKALDPSFINQVEAGLKSNLFKDKLSANITIYQIVNSNLAQTNLSNGNVNTNIKELAGEVTSKGLEVDLMSKSFYGFVLISGYSFNDTRYTKSNTYIVGSQLRYNPRHTANISLYHTFSYGRLKGLNLGMSTLYFGERQAGRSTRVTVPNDPYKLMTLPAYFLLEANIGYTKNNIGVRLKISNILNYLSYNVHDDNSVNPIAPRQLALSVTFKL